MFTARDLGIWLEEARVWLEEARKSKSAVSPKARRAVSPNEKARKPRKSKSKSTTAIN